MATGESLRTIHPGEQFTEGIFSPDGQTFAVSPLMEIAATLWDTSTGREIKKLTGFKTAAPVYGFTFGPYGRTLIWRARATVQLQDIASGRLGTRVQPRGLRERCGPGPWRQNTGDGCTGQVRQPDGRDDQAVGQRQRQGAGHPHSE